MSSEFVTNYFIVTYHRNLSCGMYIWYIWYINTTLQKTTQLWQRRIYSKRKF